MAKIDYERHSLPDIEMYAGNTDTWCFNLHDQNRTPYRYDEMTGYTFRLIIDDYGYVKRQSGLSQDAVVKTGELTQEYDGSAVVRFKFAKADTNLRSGKYTYQFEAEGLGNYHSAQGSLYVIRNINQ